MSDIESRLRDSLARRADRAPDGATLAERIVVSNDNRLAGRRRDWRIWALPLVSAGAVAAVVGAVVGIQAATKPDAHKTPHPPAISSPSQTVAPTPAPSKTWTPYAPGLHVRAMSLVDRNDLWALASDGCVDASSCPTVLLHSTGGTWSKVRTALNPNADSITFLDDKLGYLHAPDTLYMTRDGGKSWKVDSSSVSAIARTQTRVVRVVAGDSGYLRVQSAAPGSSEWTTASLPHVPMVDAAVKLATTQHYAAIMTGYGKAGAIMPMQFYFSTDDGVSWSEHDDPCQQAGRFAAVDVISAPDGSFHVGCIGTRNKTGSADAGIVMITTNGGRTFSERDLPYFPKTEIAVIEGAASADVDFSSGNGVVWRGSGNQRWNKEIVDESEGIEGGRCQFVTTEVGYCRSTDGATLWSTHDAGTTWQVAFGEDRTAMPTPPVSPPPSKPEVTGWAVQDMSFAGPTNGWALASPVCSVGTDCPAPPFVSVAHTTDGTRWLTVGDVPTASEPAAQHIRFATDTIGYVFDPNALYMTTDGGLNWTKQTGGAVALETLDNNVIRVIARPTGCLIQCRYAVETSPLGSATWSTPVAVPGPPKSHFDTLVRAPGVAYALVRSDVPDEATSVVSRSTDGGRSWTNLGEPCSVEGPDINTNLLAVGTDGSLFVFCRYHHAGHEGGDVYASTDGGRRFAKVDGIGPDQGPAIRVAAGDRDHLCVIIAGLSCTADGGASWRPAKAFGADAEVDWFGFQSASEVHALTFSGASVLWTSHDAGQHWTSSPLRPR